MSATALPGDVVATPGGIEPPEPNQVIKLDNVALPFTIRPADLSAVHMLLALLNEGEVPAPWQPVHEPGVPEPK